MRKELDRDIFSYEAIKRSNVFVLIDTVSNEIEGQIISARTRYHTTVSQIIISDASIYGINQDYDDDDFLIDMIGRFKHKDVTNKCFVSLSIVDALLRHNNQDAKQLVRPDLDLIKEYFITKRLLLKTIH